MNILTFPPLRKNIEFRGKQEQHQFKKMGGKQKKHRRNGNFALVAQKTRSITTGKGVNEYTRKTHISFPRNLLRNQLQFQFLGLTSTKLRTTGASKKKQPRKKKKRKRYLLQLQRKLNNYNRLPAFC